MFNIRSLKKTKMFDIFYNSAPLIILLLMIVLSSILSPFFYKANNILKIFLNFTINGTIAIGVAYVMIGGGLDLSIGAIMSVSAAISIMTLNYFENVYIAVIFGILTGMFIGLINGLLITKGKINPFIATLGTFIALGGFVIFLTNSSSIFGEVFYYSYIFNGKLLFINFPIWIFIIFLIISGIVLSKTMIGKRIYSVGGNEYVCKLLGINVDNVKIFTYVFSGFCCAIAGIFLSSRAMAAAASFGQFTMFQVLGAIILGGISLRGGKGNVFKAFIGIAILAVLSNIFGLMGIHSFTQQYVWGGLLIAVTILDSLQFRKRNQ